MYAWRAQALSSFGFRGEALSSLCAVSEVTVTTRREGSHTGTRLSYNQAGVLTAFAAAARSKGTTVAVKELFKPLPVRYKVRPDYPADAQHHMHARITCMLTILLWHLQELRRNLKREYAKLLGLLQAYALIAAGVRIICTNQVRTDAVDQHASKCTGEGMPACLAGRHRGADQGHLHTGTGEHARQHHHYLWQPHVRGPAAARWGDS